MENFGGSNFMSEFTRIGRENFLKRNKHVYQLIRWSKLPFNENGYAVVPEDHQSLFVRYMYSNDGVVINRFKDGERRRNRLFIDGLIIRTIKPQITFYEMFYNLVHRVFFYYDNSDGILSDELILEKTKDVMAYDMSKTNFHSPLVGTIVTSKSYCTNHGYTRRSYARKALQHENFIKIKGWYNPELSVTENRKIAKEKGEKVCLSTLKRFCKA